MHEFHHPHFDDPLIVLLIGFAPLFGACVGSFLNVVVYRLPREHLSIVAPGSHCFFCGTMLPWYENVPIVSYLALGGKCSHCRVAISPLYLLTELFGALLFLGITWQFFTGGSAFARFGDAGYGPVEQAAVLAGYLVFTSALVAASWIDFRHRIIPDEISMGGFAVALAFVFAVPSALGDPGVRALARGLEHAAALGSPESRLSGHAMRTAIEGWTLTHRHLEALVGAGIGALVGSAMIWGIGWVGSRLFRQEAMGFGDVKLMALLGAMLGWRAVLVSMLLACFIGAFLGGGAKLLAVTWRWIRRGTYAIDHYMPFGPSLAAGALVLLLFRPHVYGYLERLVSPRGP